MVEAEAVTNASQKAKHGLFFYWLCDKFSDTHTHLKQVLLAILAQTQKTDKVPVMNWDEGSFVRIRKALMNWKET